MEIASMSNAPSVPMQTGQVFCIEGQSSLLDWLKQSALVDLRCSTIIVR